MKQNWSKLYMKNIKDQIKSLAATLNIASKISKAQSSDDKRLLYELATSNDPDVRMAVASNVHADGRSLRLLAMDYI